MQQATGNAQFEGKVMTSNGRRAKLASALMVGTFLFSGLACSHTLVSSLSVPLEFHPKTNTGGSAATSVQTKVFIAPVADLRANPTAIGENREQSTPVPILWAGQSPAEFVRQGVADQFGRDGITIVDAPEKADRIVAITLSRLWATEDQTYDAQVNLGVQVQDPAGKVLWSGTTSGEGSNFGKSLSIENYQETYSEALVKAAQNLIDLPAFHSAVTIGTSASSPMVPATQPTGNPLGTP
ncbi:MAG: hypothetical protein M3O30_13700 [Planctomycetota bacterium]|nr:hypothetical protein [Planctomycetota bacterium]